MTHFSLLALIIGIQHLRLSYEANTCYESVQGGPQPGQALGMLSCTASLSRGGSHQGNDLVAV